MPLQLSAAFTVHSPWLGGCSTVQPAAHAASGAASKIQRRTRIIDMDIDMDMDVDMDIDIDRCISFSIPAAAAAPAAW
jgi:hypothetical protein